MKKYIVSRNGHQYVESSSQVPPDALVEFTGQIPEADIKYAIVTTTAEVVDGVAITKQVVTVDNVTKDADLAIAIAGDLASKWKLMRATRDALLTKTDFMVFADYPIDPVTKGAILTYRQQLRDLPSAITDIQSFSYPVAPLIS